MELVIPKELDGVLLRDWLRQNGFSRASVTRLKNRDDGMLINGETVTVRHILKIGELLSIAIDDNDNDKNPCLVPTEMPLDIIYEDDDIIAVNKPYGMPTHPSIRHFDDTLANGLCAYFEKQNKPFVFRSINRLDSDTDGIVLVAKNKLTASRLTKKMQNGQIKKSYIAILNGVVDKNGRIEEYMRRQKESIIIREVCDKNTPDAKIAITEFERLYTDGKASIVRAYPITGRTHQLRVHFSHIGHSLIGDEIYGTALSEPSEYDKKIHRHALHADTLEIIGERIFTAPPMSDMQTIIEEIKTNNYKYID